MEYDEESIGTFPKVLLGTLGAMGIALIVYLIYAAVRGPESPEPPAPVPVAVLAKNDKPKPSAPATKPASKPLASKLPKPVGLSAFDDAEGRIAARKGKSAKTKPSSAPAILSPEDLFAKASPAVVRIEVRDKDFKVISVGSGFFITEDGVLVTNQHVIKDAHFASARLSNGSTFFVNGVVAVDVTADLAILKVNGKGLPHLSIAKDAIPKIGAKVFAIGNPKGLTNTFSQGMVSGHRQPTKDLTIVQTTAAISHGSSGGPLLDTHGEVVGVTTAAFMGGQNLNFAVPAAAVRRLIRKQGKSRTLASAGGKPLDRAGTEELAKAFAAMAKKDWNAAAKILTSLRKTQKDNPFVWFALGRLHSQLGNHEIAVGMYKTAIAIKPHLPDAYFNMGIAYAHLKRYREEIAAYKMAIAFKPNDADAYFNMGAAYIALKRYADAIAAYRKAVTFKPDYAKAYYYMGQAYQAMGRNSDATAAYNKARELEQRTKLPRPKDPVQRMLDAVAARQAKARELLADGKAALNANKPAEAAALFRKGLELAPNLTEATKQLKFALGLLGADKEPPALTQLERRNRIRRQLTNLDIEKALENSSEILARAKKPEDFQASANAAQVAMDTLVVNKVLYTPKSYRDWRAKIENQLKLVATKQVQWEARIREDQVREMRRIQTERVER